MNFAVTIPHNTKGGVANYYQVLKNYLGDDIIYIERGSASKDANYFKKVLRLFKDYFRFSYLLLFYNRERVLINTSLGSKSLNRDLIYILISKLFFKKTILFIHGWDKDYEQKFFSSQLKIKKKVFSTCNSYIVLSKEFKEKLIGHGISSPIYLLTTVVDDKFAHYNKLSTSEKKEEITLLFLARIEKEKGIMEALKAYRRLKRNGVNINFLIAGDGSYLSKIREYIKIHDLPDVDIFGFVRGSEKSNTFNRSDIYLFPSYHGEGMPTTVLEAMAKGLPIVTTPVGGLRDFFEEDKMGLLLENSNPKYIAGKIEYLLDRPGLMNKMSHYNYNYAKKHFYASRVSARLKEIIDSV